MEKIKELKHCPLHYASYILGKGIDKVMYKSRILVELPKNDYYYIYYQARETGPSEDASLFVRYNNGNKKMTVLSCFMCKHTRVNIILFMSCCEVY